MKQDIHLVQEKGYENDLAAKQWYHKADAGYLNVYVTLLIVEDFSRLDATQVVLAS